MRNNNESRADKWCLLTKKYAKKEYTTYIRTNSGFTGNEGQIFLTQKR